MPVECIQKCVSSECTQQKQHNGNSIISSVVLFILATKDEKFAFKKFSFLENNLIIRIFQVPNFLVNDPHKLTM